MEPTTTYSDLFKQIKEEEGLRPFEIARAMDVHTNTISFWLSKRRHMSKHSFICFLMLYKKQSLDDCLEERGLDRKQVVRNLDHVEAE